MLPLGEAGMRVVEDLGGPLGLANLHTGAIALDHRVTKEPWPGATELHERPHLIEAFLPVEVAAVMSRMPQAPGPGVASESRTQHFAEMASEAWQLLVEPEGMCLSGTPAERFRAAEARVPGMSGFVLWYLRHPLLASTDTAAILRPLAGEIAEPYLAEWTALWAALDARRVDGGTFRRWPAPTMASALERRQLQLRVSGRWWDVATSYLFEPSRLLLRVLTM